MDCNTLKKEIISYLDASITVKATKKECTIIFPIYGRGNDLIELSVRPSSVAENKYWVSDDAETISNLIVLAVNPNESLIGKKVLSSLQKSFDITIENGEMYIISTWNYLFRANAPSPHNCYTP